LESVFQKNADYFLKLFEPLSSNAVKLVEVVCYQLSNFLNFLLTASFSFYSSALPAFSWRELIWPEDPASAQAAIKPQRHF
jgi:hypothetical protein